MDEQKQMTVAEFSQLGVKARREKHGGEEGFRAEMKRLRSLPRKKVKKA